MIEVILCSLITILPDYLLRRRFQGKRWGHEITFFTVWYELRWGITLCAMLTIGLITLVFYYHPTASNVSSFFRTVTVLPDSSGRVQEVFVTNNQNVDAGAPLFRLDSARQDAAAQTARRQIEEVDAALALAAIEQAQAQAALDQARASYQQTFEDLERTKTLTERGSVAVSARELEQLENQLDASQAAVDAALAGLNAVQTKISTALPAQRATAQAALAQTELEIEKLTVYAGTSGTLEQFALQVGDIVNPLRPAGILVPAGMGRNRFQAGFPQISAQVVKQGGVAEIMCVSKPFTIIPMVIVEVQDVIAAGQVRPTDRLADAQTQGPPGTITAFLEPVYPGQTDDIPPGSRCVANAYTNSHDQLDDPDLGFGQKIFLHVVDTIGVVHAAGLRLQSLVLPLQTLVFSGH